MKWNLQFEVDLQPYLVTFQQGTAGDSKKALEELLLLVGEQAKAAFFEQLRQALYSARRFEETLRGPAR